MEKKLYCSQCARSEYDRDHVTHKKFLHCLAFTTHMPLDAHNASQCYMFEPEGPIAEQTLREVLASRKKAKAERKKRQTTGICEG